MNIRAGLSAFMAFLSQNHSRTLDPHGALEDSERSQERLCCVARGISHIGRIRRENEDAIRIGDWHTRGQAFSEHEVETSLSQPLILLVSDGMGGYEGGRQASQMIVEKFGTTGDASDIEQSLQRIDAQMSELTINQPSLASMGATIAGALIHNNRLVHFNVGDSRVYHYRKGHLRQLSTDDRAGETHYLTQAIGGPLRKANQDFDAHVGLQNLLPGDQVLLSSDGLCDLLADDEIAEIISIHPQDAIEKLVSLALNRGGQDNISVVLAEFSG